MKMLCLYMFLSIIFYVNLICFMKLLFYKRILPYKKKTCNILHKFYEIYFYKEMRFLYFILNNHIVSYFKFFSEKKIIIKNSYFINFIPHNLLIGYK